MASLVGALLLVTSEDPRVEALVKEGILKPVKPAGGKLYGYKIPFRILAGGRDVSSDFVVIKTGRCDPGRFKVRVQEEFGVLFNHSHLPVPRDPDILYESMEDISAEKAVAKSLGWQIGKACKVSAWDRFVCNGRQSRLGWTELVLMSRERYNFLAGKKGQKITALLESPDWPAKPRPPQGQVVLEIAHPQVPGEAPVPPSRMVVAEQLSM